MEKENPKNSKKQEQLDTHKEDSTNKHLTTNQGVRINDNQHTLSAGERGPSLLEDFIFREKMTHFDHERIPERVVHPRGSGAHGVFEAYESMKEFTKASFLSEAGKKTPVFVRFSTVVGFRGSTDLARDVRGFATKFYTDEGVYDLVGNNIPVFFIQDAIKFPDLVHSIKPEPKHEMPQATAAHDNFWDFASLMPEATHVIMWILSGRGIPRSYRMMEGFGVHTFKWINEEGKVTFVKYHWKPTLGTHGVVWDEAQKISGMDPDFHRRDLYEAIENGNYPEFELGVQIVAEEDEHKFDFDLLDPTKLIPEEIVPVKKVGKMTLNRNPDNFFAETEQVAFHPGHVVPGIDFTNDPLLQGRLFSYTDTQLIRLGGPNFHEIPINRSVAPVHNNQRDGFMRQTINKGNVNYEPNSTGGGCPFQVKMKDGGFVSHTERIDAHKIRARSKSFNDYFSQATLFWNSQTPPEQKQITNAFLFELGKVERQEIQKRMVGLLTQVDKDLAKNVAEGLGFQVPDGPMKPVQGGVPADDDPADYEPVNNKQAVKEDKTLSMDFTKKGDITSRMIAFLCADGVDENSVKAVKESLMEKSAMVKIIAPHGGKIKTSGGSEIPVDKTFNTTGSVLFDAVYIPSGAGSIEKLMESAEAVKFLHETYKHYKPIAMDGDAKKLLKATYIEHLVESINQMEQGVIIKDSNSGLADDFIKAIGQHRFWNREETDKIPT
ncbi:catalase [Salinimicrobium xinjiangense]|uniref:catalase n=1 Tax=Salinimicrobium xinjiangense TaxID=438596 RepID=UPI0004241268|nr:catalase [Salinimicrobium xinjiangense]